VQGHGTGPQSKNPPHIILMSNCLKSKLQKLWDTCEPRSYHNAYFFKVGLWEPPTIQQAILLLQTGNPYSFDRGFITPKRIRVRVTLQLTVSQSVCLSVEPPLGLMARYLFFSKVTVLSLWGALSDERVGQSFVRVSP
jgi:hypothetical protein